MKKSLYFSLPVTLLYLQTTLAQDPAQLRSFYSMGQANATGSFGGVIATTAPSPSLLNLNVYFDSPSMKDGFISIEGYNQPFGPFPLRYNIRANQLETIISSVPINLQLDKVLSFMYADSLGNKSYFVAERQFDSEVNPKKSTFYQQVFLGSRLSLYRSRSVKLTKQPFNPLDVNRSTEPKVTVTEDYFVERGGKLYIFSNRKDLGALLKEENGDKLIKSEKINVQKESDLIRLFALINQ